MFMAFVAYHSGTPRLTAGVSGVCGHVLNYRVGVTALGV
jgi:hypothetical protein